MASGNDTAIILPEKRKFNAYSPISTLIISSSLHGIILAEAYGVPAILLGTNLDLFKFRDYYYSTGRFDYPIAESIQEALRTQPAPLPDLSKLQNDLIRSFPTDIWQ